MTWKPPESDIIIDSSEEKWKAPEGDPVISRDPGIMDYVRSLNRGIEKGVTSLLGAPTDITSSILRKVGIISEDASPPIGGSESIKKGFERIGLGANAPDVESSGTRVAERVGEEFGFGIFPAMGMYKTAMRAATTAPSLIRRTFLDPIAKSPGSAAVQDVTSTAASAAGAGVAREIAPDSKTAETVGQVAGGFAPAATAFSPTRLGIKAVRSLYSRFNTKAQIEASKRAVQDIMGRSLDREAMESLSAAQALSERTGGQFQPSIAESTGVPSLVATQKQLEREATDEFLNKVTQRRVNNQKAIENFIQRSAPEGEVNPEIVVDAANNTVKLQGKKLEEEVAKVVQNKKDIASNLPTIDKMTSGASIRDAIFKAKSAASMKMNQVSKELGLDNIDMTDAFENWKTGVRENYNSVSRFDNVSDKPKILKDIIAETEKVPTSFIDVKTLRERVSDELIDELSSANPSRQKVRTLTMLKKDVDTLFESAGGEVGESLKAFRKQYFEEYVKPFETGAMFKSRNNDGTGFFRTRDEQVADLFLDNPSSARQFRTVFGDGTPQMKNIEDAFLDKMRASVAPDGEINDKKLIAFVNKNKDVLKELPSLQAKVANIESAQKAVIQRQSELALRQDSIERDALIKQITKYAEGSITADKVLESALKDERKMQRLLTFIRNDQDAINSLKRTVWERATKGDSADILKFMAEHEKALTKLFSKEQFNDIQDITAMKAMMEVIPSQAGQAHIPTPLEHIEKMVGMGVPQASTRWYALMTGRLSKSYLIADISKSILLAKGRANIENLLKDALYDPQVAREMATAVRVGRLPEALGKRLSARVFALGIPYLRNKEEEE